VEYFWNKATYNNAINDQAAANIMFLALWGSGSYGIRDMQKAIGTTADGIVGPITVQKINANKKAAEILYQALDKRYRLLASVNPSVYSKYLKGWLNRLSELKPDKIAAISIGAIAAIGLLYYLATNR
jgi:lysozyme family protein